MLDEFRSTSITWDKATRRIYSPITANASDSNGRKLNIQVVNSGQVENLTGATLHLYWETKDKTQHGLDAFTASDISKGEFEIFYTTGMLSNVGELNATLVLVDSTGKVVSDWFKITVTRGINEDAIESENSFSSLTKALIDVSNLEQNYAPRLNDLTAQLQQKRDLSVKLKGTDLDTSTNANKVQLINLSSEVQAAMAGTAPVIGTVTDGSLTTEKYADGSVARAKLNLPSVFDYENAFKYPTSKITMNNCTVAYSDRKLVVTPTDATKWWGFGVSADVFVADVANFGSQLVISESASHYLSIALTGGNAGYFYKLSKTDTTFETGTYQDRLTLDLTGYTHIMAVRHNATTLKLYKYNGAWELVATVDISKYFYSGFASAGIVFGTSKSTSEVLNSLFYIPDRNATNAIKGWVDSLQTQITSLSTQADTLNYPWAGETAYFIGDSITDFDLYQPYLKTHLKLDGYYNFTQSGAPLCNVVDRTHLLTKTDDMLAYLTETGKSPKLVIIWGGTNDFGLDCPLGTIESGTTYTLGALRRIIDKINTAHPKCTIIGVTPMQRNATGGSNLAGMGPNAQGLYLKDYSDGIKSVFEDNGVPVIDMYKNSGINVYNVNNTDILRDGLHPADIFNPRIAFMFAKFISNYTKIV